LGAYDCTSPWHVVSHLSHMVCFSSSVCTCILACNCVDFTTANRPGFEGLQGDLHCRTTRLDLRNKSQQLQLFNIAPVRVQDSRNGVIGVTILLTYLQLLLNLHTSVHVIWPSTTRANCSQAFKSPCTPLKTTMGGFLISYS